MKKYIFVLVVLLFKIHSSCMAQTALGIRAGEPSGFNLKFYTSRNSALDIVLGCSYIKQTFTYQTDGIDYGFPVVMINLVRQKPVSRRSDAEYYIGGGVTYQRVKYLGSTAAVQGQFESRFIFNVPIGLEYFLGGGNFSLYAEFKPALEILPGFGAFYPDPAVGFRLKLD